MSSLEFGDVVAVDYASCRVRVRLDERDGLVTYWLHVPQRHTQGTKARPLMPEIGEQVAVLLEDDGVEGVVLGGSTPPPSRPLWLMPIPTTSDSVMAAALPMTERRTRWPFNAWGR